MEYVSGIRIRVRNEGTATSGSVHRISVMVASMSEPTRISAGAVAADGTMPTKGAATMAPRNKRPVTMAVMPLRPPAMTPAVDST